MKVTITGRIALTEANAKCQALFPDLVKGMVEILQDQDFDVVEFDAKTGAFSAEQIFPDDQLREDLR